MSDVREQPHVVTFASGKARQTSSRNRPALEWLPSGTRTRSGGSSSLSTRKVSTGEKWYKYMKHRDLVEDECLRNLREVW